MRKLLGSAEASLLMGYIQGEGRDQGTLFPMSLDDFVPIDHMCRVIDAFVETLVTLQSDTTVPILKTPLPSDYDVTFSSGDTRLSTSHVDAISIIPGPWILRFPPNWGAPPQVQLAKIESWTASSNPGVRYFSGTAMYQTKLNLTALSYCS